MEAGMRPISPTRNHGGHRRQTAAYYTQPLPGLVCQGTGIGSTGLRTLISSIYTPHREAVYARRDGGM